MHYVSTRGQAPPHTFAEAVMAGLAPDGGLFLPEALPAPGPEWAALRGRPFAQVFQAIATPFLGGEIPAADLEALVQRSFAGFAHPLVTPVVRVGPLHVLELFHGPTLAFKDVALQFLGNLFEWLLARSRSTLTVVGATSGDTGSAAIQALRGKRGMEVFILFPRGRVSRMQQLQMTTVPDANVHALAVEGTFDDAQDIVKGLFNDRAFNARYHLAAVNSINWARVLAQMTYFFHAYFQVLEQRPGMQMGDPIQVSVPTGNFGHIYAGVLARRMGLPIARLILASNANSILPRFVASGEYRPQAVVQTLSPSMDIQVASNFERYLYDLAGRDAALVLEWLGQLRSAGRFQVGPERLRQVQQDFAAQAVDDAATLATIRQVHEEWGYLLDPHSATGVRAALDHARADLPTLCMATAHPAKFGDAVRQAIGQAPPLPAALAGLEGAPQRVQVLPARLQSVQDCLRRTLAGRQS
ncbi:MAG TPA: threonine synthase [bacterium]|nr:threonine synthase [bacterium]